MHPYSSLQQIKKDTEESFNRRFKEQMAIVATSALTLIAALAWNDAAQFIFDRFVKVKHTQNAKIIYAIVMTLVSVVSLVLIHRWAYNR